MTGSIQTSFIVFPYTVGSANYYNFSFIVADVNYTVIYSPYFTTKTTYNIWNYKLIKVSDGTVSDTIVTGVKKIVGVH